MSEEPRGIFITGTDTGVGKTWCSRLIADRIASQGTRVTYLKPVQTGCERARTGELVAPDFEYVIAGGATRIGSCELHVPYRFEPACSPHLAAEMASVSLVFSHIKRSFDQLAEAVDVVVVEGAGGLLVPLGVEGYMTDLIDYLAIPVVLVTSPRLGTLNHTLLSIEALASRGLKLLGIVYNNHDNAPEDFIYKDNLQTIEDATAVPVCEVRYGCSSPESVKEICERVIHG